MTKVHVCGAPMRALPRKGDKSDVRCAFAQRTCVAVDEDHWCMGCDFYVCEVCDQEQPAGNHDVMEHRSLENE
jgi:hypothetical protein